MFALGFFLGLVAGVFFGVWITFSLFTLNEDE
jgi:hypothetical protein